MKWNSVENLENLLLKLVSWDSRTGTNGEKKFPYKLKELIVTTLEYFNINNHLIQLNDIGQERNSLTALYLSDKSNAKTIVLMSHFDTVHTEEFGENEHLAFNPKELEVFLKERTESLSDIVKKDLYSGNFLFGRGTMDMKMGLALHIHILELAIHESWPINILLLTVPDEEINSDGMRLSIPVLINLEEKYDLEYNLFLNSEPSFSQYPDDNNYYIYSGSIGKIMPASIFFGKETHAGEPLSGINSYYMASFLNKEMELNDSFSESFHEENTPLPLTLKGYDLKDDYSTQTSNHVASLYNIFVMKQSAENIMNKFYNINVEAMQKCKESYNNICYREKVKPIKDIKVLKYEDLIRYATRKLGDKRISKIKNDINNIAKLDNRLKSLQICDAIMKECWELSPAVVTLYVPPYYPAVNSSNNHLIRSNIELSKKILKSKFDVTANQIHYFNGISDLSYVNFNKYDVGWKTYPLNNPVWELNYSIPFEMMQKLEAPVLNIGPFGKDAHKLNERLHKKSAFVETPFLLKEVILNTIREEKIN